MRTKQIIELAGPYQKRPIRFLHVAEIDGWSVKVYGISVKSERPDDAFVEAAERLATERLPQPAVWSAPPDGGPDVSDDRYGVAIMVLHEGREGDFALLSWWVGENMLQHRVHFAPSDSSYTFDDLEGGAIACVWELAVIAFERDAWVETILANPDGPDIDAYLARRLSADV